VKESPRVREEAFAQRDAVNDQVEAEFSAVRERIARELMGVLYVPPTEQGAMGAKTRQTIEALRDVRFLVVESTQAD
jgi:hypothetical protein